jgi:TetR/AcrR family transcriptional repressor for divergent bdcA
MTKEICKVRGRPRKFDPQEAVAVAQDLFHARGYDAVSVAEVSDALGIKAPSFYAAFGSKAGLFGRVIARYAEHGAVPIAALLTPGRPVAEGLAALLMEAAQRYGADPEASGCIVLAGCGSGDPDARTAAQAARTAAEQLVFDFIAAEHPARAAELTDYISTVMTGLSAKARQGQSRERLLEAARIAGLGLSAALAA